MVETCLPGDDVDFQNPYPLYLLGIATHLNLSSSMSSLSIGSVHSPTDKDSVIDNASLARLHRPSQQQTGAAKRAGSVKRKTNKKCSTPDGGRY